MKMIFALHANESLLETFTVMPPCAGYYTDFFGQVLLTNLALAPFEFAFGKVSTAHVMQVAGSAVETTKSKKNQFRMTILESLSEEGQVDPVFQKWDNKKIFVSQGETLQAIMVARDVQDMIIILIAQFVPKPNSPVKFMKHIDDLAPGETTLEQNFMKIPMNMFCTTIEFVLLIDGAAAGSVGRIVVLRAGQLENQADSAFADAGGDIFDEYPAAGAAIDSYRASDLVMGIIPWHVEKAEDFYSDRDHIKVDQPISESEMFDLQVDLVAGTIPTKITIDVIFHGKAGINPQVKRTVFAEGNNRINLNEIMRAGSVLD